MSASAEFTPAILIRRAVFLLALLLLTFFYLFVDFQGLSTTSGMDQAQIAREIVRGNKFSTKFIRPLAVYHANKSLEGTGQEVTLSQFSDTFHSPLGPVVNSVGLRFFQGEGDFSFDRQALQKTVFPPDLAIAGMSVVLFLSSVGIFYLLIGRIFDGKIAGVSVTLVILSPLFWEYTQSGLPQMLMLFLFSFALYFSFKAVEATQVDRSPFVWVGLAAVFFGLLALSHWLAVWIFVGYLIYAVICFKPRGTVALVTLALFLLVITPWLVRNTRFNGQFTGLSFYALYEGLGGDIGNVMRNLDPERDPLNAEGLQSKVAFGAVRQLDDLLPFLGSILVAPVFFLSLLHPFRRPEIASFRWCILLMWIMALLGMSLFGVQEKIDSNQLHLLFAPIMTAYGLAFLSVLWNRLNFSSGPAFLANGHLIIVVLLAAIPMLLLVPRAMLRGGSPVKYNYPYIPAINAALSEVVRENEVVMTDQPWAVAWYADRLALWVPKDNRGLVEMEEYGAEKGTPMAGVFFTPVSVTEPLNPDIIKGPYRNWTQVFIQPYTRYFSEVPEDLRYKVPVFLGQEFFFLTDSQRELVGQDEQE
ncbi:MAG: glycosyltransferase family 39 protein [Verrucomicrobiota bacterium]